MKNLNWCSIMEKLTLKLLTAVVFTANNVSKKLKLKAVVEREIDKIMFSNRKVFFTHFSLEFSYNLTVYRFSPINYFVQVDKRLKHNLPVFI